MGSKNGKLHFVPLVNEKTGKNREKQGKTGIRD